MNSMDTNDGILSPVKNPSPTSRTLAAALLSVVLAFGFGCSSKPKLADGERAVKERIEKESDGRLRLATFKMTGDEGTAGIDTFAWAFEGELEVVEDCVWLVDHLTGTLPVDFRTAAGTSKEEGRPLKQGQRYGLVGAVYLSKGNNGWEAGHIAMRKIPREIK